MKLLLDTHLVLWVFDAPERLSAAAIALITDERNALFYSAVSVWETSIKSALQKPDFHIDPYLLRAGLLKNGYTEMGINGDHAVEVRNLPVLHKDPFDRILIAQATVEGMLLLTADAILAQYPGPIRKV